MNELRYREALGQAMAEEMERDPRVFLIGEEVGAYNGAYKVSAGLLERFGEGRVVDTPISEGGFTGVGIGAAMTGLRPIVEFMTWNFSLVAFDQLINNAAKMVQMSGGQVGCPIVFRGAGGAGGALGSQHSQCFESFYAHTPGLVVVAPYTPADAKGLLKSAIRSEDPVVFIEAEVLYTTKGDVPEGEYLVPLGKADRVREGGDCTVVTWSRARGWCEEAAEQLSAKGIEVDLLDLRTLRPMDLDAVLESVARTGSCVVVHEGWPTASLGTEVMARVQERGFDLLDAPVLQVCNRDLPMPYARPLEQWVLPLPERIVEAVRRSCYR
jgi:pyruvate dehydrogenase E1 component beta subunit